MFKEIYKTRSSIVSIQKMGGFFKKDVDGKKYWYPERLMVASKHTIYEWIPEEKSVAVYSGRNFKITWFKNKHA